MRRFSRSVVINSAVTGSVGKTNIIHCMTRTLLSVCLNFVENATVCYKVSQVRSKEYNVERRVMEAISGNHKAIGYTNLT